MWVTDEEAQALAKGEIPLTVQVRIARFHLVDNTRGEPRFWGRGDVRNVDMKLEGDALIGKVHLEAGNGERGYTADVRGVVKVEDGKLKAFDVVALGDYWGRAAVTDRAEADKYPLAVTFRVSDLKCEASRVAPGACRGGTGGYLNAT